MNMSRANQLVKQAVESRIFHYAIAGGVAFTLEYGFFLVLVYSVAVKPEVANIVSFSIGLISSFLLNKLWVFGHQQQNARSRLQAILYISLAVSNLALTTVGLHLLIENGTPAFAAKFLLIGLVACWNFFIFQKVIFRSGLPKN